LNQGDRMNNNQYTKTAIILHWLIALIIFAMFALGWYMADLPKEAPKAMAFDLFDLGVYTWQLSEEVSPRTFYFNLHKSIGVTLFVLVLFRILWRISHRPPALLDSMSVVEKKIATAGHHLLYLFMVAMPISGIVMAVNSKYGLKWFGVLLVEGLDNLELRECFEEIHEVLGIIFALLILVHILGALKHKFINKDQTMSRMSICSKSKQ
jgi:cytochrome b561